MQAGFASEGQGCTYMLSSMHPSVPASPPVRMHVAFAVALPVDIDAG